MSRSWCVLAVGGLWWLSAAAPASSPALSLAEAMQAALQEQPALVSQAARRRAAEARSVSAGALPDPQLSVALGNLSLSDPNPYRGDADPMAMSSLSLSQEFPNAAKRRLAARRERGEASVEEAGLAALSRQIERDTALSWLAVWQAQNARALARAQIDETRRLAEAETIAFRAGRAPQSAVLAAEIETGVLHDRSAAWAQEERASRAQLSRWIGPAAAQRELATSPPVLPPPPSLAQLQAALARHPWVEQARQRVEVAQAQLDLAKAQKQPDWRVEAGYSYRQPYDDLISLRVGFDLPWFSARRQDQDVLAAREQAAGDEAAREDRLRQLSAELDARYGEWQSLGERLARYEQGLLPLAAARSEAALAAYRSGDGALAEVLRARTSALELRLQTLQLQTERLQQRVMLRWLAAGEPS